MGQVSKTIPCCPDCGCPDMRRDATAAWNPHEGRWECVSVLDTFTCESCGQSTKQPVWKELAVWGVRVVRTLYLERVFTVEEAVDAAHAKAQAVHMARACATGQFANCTSKAMEHEAVEIVEGPVS